MAATTFGKLGIGSVFEFVPGPYGQSYYGGPYIKTSARKYKEVNSSKIHTIGSVSAKVERQGAKQNPNIITPLKALVGQTIKVIKRGGKILGIPVSSTKVRKARTKRRLQSAIAGSRRR